MVGALAWEGWVAWEEWEVTKLEGGKKYGFTRMRSSMLFTSGI